MCVGFVFVMFYHDCVYVMRLLMRVCIVRVVAVRFWRQVPGHLLCVESNSLGVVWGIGHNHTAWVYTGGFREDSTQTQGKVDVFASCGSHCITLT